MTFLVHIHCVMVRVRYFEVSPELLLTAYPLGYTWKSFLLTSHAFISSRLLWKILELLE